MKVAVIVLIYNVAKTLNQCVDSILKQTYQNLEVILVNDGSTDDSLRICCEYEQKDPRVKVISQKNSGPSAVRNSGIQHATADFITFVDADDFLAPTHIENLVQQQQYYHSDIAVASYMIIHNDGKYFLPVDPYSGSPDYDGLYTPEQWLKTGFLEQGVLDVVAWGKLFRRELFNNVLFPEDKRVCDDEYTSWRLTLAAKTISFKNDETYIYRTNPNSITHQKSSRIAEAQQDALKERISTMTMLGMETAYLRDHYLNNLRKIQSEALSIGDYLKYKKSSAELALFEADK